LLRSIEKHLFDSKGFKSVFTLLSEKENISVAGISGSAISFLLKNLYKKKFSNLVCLTSSIQKAEQIWGDLSNTLSEEVFYFPAKGEESKYTHRLKSEVIGLQLKSLDRIIEQKSGIYIVPVSALKEVFPEPQQLKKSRLLLSSGKEIEIDQITNKLVEFGYEPTDLVSGVGEFCVRGGLLDMFPFETLNPVRIEFFGDIIETIRSFDAIDQRSKNNLNQVTILPPTVKSGKEQKSKTLLDFFKKDTLLFLDEPEQFERTVLEDENNSNSSFEVEEILKEIEDEKSSSEWNIIQLKIEKFRRVEHRKLGSLKNVDVHFKMKSNEDFRGNIPLLRKKLNQFVDKQKDKKPKAFVLLEEKYEVERLLDLLEEHDIRDQIIVGQGILNSGFQFPLGGIMVITEKDIYGRVPRKRNLGKYRSGIPISKINAIKYGDLMVHVDHGIGRYLGLTKIRIASSEQECLKLQYRNDDILYVNIDHLRRVSQFNAGEGVVPQLNQLGGKDWDRLKEKTQKAIEKMAKDLLDLYAHRKAETGFAFSKDQSWQKELEASFLYDETPDQLRTIEEVKRDMEVEPVMDRLVCGDVGFGKTEVALRASFKAVLDGKQVALLVPTTVLAQQHFQTFKERLSQYPIEVALLSRLRTKLQQKSAVERLKLGKIDIVIGTHRLLSKDIEFKDLGLLIVDEEHRFGVRQKEKIKTLFKLVDVLSLTATPIPRTLHLALMGSRDMSSINTPPKDRMPVITEVVPFDKNLIRQAILDEVNRGGQVFVVHNRVRSIESMANMIQRLIPDLRIAVAHGQMNGTDLERIMLDFINKKYDCLVSTMIIESGLDMPNVNTLIVNRADKLGLAQLYQLKGRVGRSNRQAFAYFLAPAFKFLSTKALKRLQTIEEHLELGAGLQIAMKDLEIRGAGNLLGSQQSGFINAVGFDMYCKLLNETVAKIKGELPENEESALKLDVFVESEYDAYLPEDYVNMDYERVNIYQRLTNVESENDLNDLEEELRDRFGVLPKPTRVLIELTRLRLLCARLGIEKLKIKKGELTAYFSDTYFENSNQELLQKVVRSIQESSTELLRFLHGKKFGFKLQLKQTDETSLHFTREFFNHIIKKAA